MSPSGVTQRELISSRSLFKYECSTQLVLTSDGLLHSIPIDPLSRYSCTCLAMTGVTDGMTVLDS